MSQNKQEKKRKERERRVAQKKAADSQRIARELAAAKTQAGDKVSRVFTASLTAPLENAPPKSTETSTLRPGPG